MSDYAEYPVSLSERKAIASRRAKDWTPRDALISVLRDVDAGADIDAVVICYRQKNGEEVNTHFAMASSDCLSALGLLSRASYMINNDG